MNPRPTHAIPSKLIQVLKPIIEVRQKKTLNQTKNLRVDSIVVKMNQSNNCDYRW
jgi:hypothetical protein